MRRLVLTSRTAKRADQAPRRRLWRWPVAVLAPLAGHWRGAGADDGPTRASVRYKAYVGSCLPFASETGDRASTSDYGVDAAKADAFYAQIRRYGPALPDGALQPGYAGIRPKIHDPGEPAADFRFNGAAMRAPVSCRAVPIRPCR